MKNVVRTGVAALALTLLASCGGTWDTSNVQQTSAATTASTPASEINLYSGDLTGRQYRVLKKHLLVTVNKSTALHPSPTAQMVKDKMQKEAAKLGADAIIFATISSVRIGLASWGVREGKGTAFQFTD